MALASLRSFLKAGEKKDEGSLTPCLGFQVKLDKQQLSVTIIGARHLPKAEGYLVKVRLCPGKSQQETEVLQESWPMFQQTFLFPRPANADSSVLVLTACALEPGGHRRAVGAISWRLSELLKINDTGEMWRDIVSLQRTSTPTSQRQVQVWVCVKENVLRTGVSAVKWDVKSTKELKASKTELYVKIELLRDGERIKAQSSQFFEPGISIRLQSEHDSMLEVPVESPSNLDIGVSLCIKHSRMAKKMVLGRTKASCCSTAILEAYASPGQTISLWLPLD